MTSIRQAFVREDQRVLGELARFISEAQDGDGEPNRETLTAFARGVRTHIRIEEEILFPVAERVVQDPEYGLTAALRREHGALRNLLGEIERALGHDDRAALAGNLRELQAALRLHLTKEEQVLYPLVERTLGSSTVLEMAALLSHRAA